jgi:two-component system sensor histidine kinase DesK
MCLLLSLKVSWAVYAGGAGQVPFIAALFALPVLYAFPGGRQRLARYRWPVLGAQAVLTWVPFAVFGGQWTEGLGGLLAGLVLLMLAGPVSWLLAGLLLAADVAVRAAVTGLEFTPAWAGVLWAIVVFVDDGLWFFGVVRLAQIVGEVEQARRQSADLAVARERLQAARALQAAVGERLAGIADMAAAARRALSSDAAQARTRIGEAGAAARQAVARARDVAAEQPAPPEPEPAGEASIGTRLAWAVLVAVLAAYSAGGIVNLAIDHDGPRLGGLLVASYVVTVALQLRHSWAARQGTRPRAWPATLAVQAVLAYVFFLPPLAGFMNFAPFLAGSVLLLVPGRWRWPGYAAMVVSWSVLYATVPLHGFAAADRGAFVTVYQGANIAVVGLVVYGLSLLAGQARELAALRGELSRVAAVRERLRVARDVHDLLGLGLSAVALKADLITALIGRDDARAAAEIGEMGRICAAAQADIRRVTAAATRLSLSAEATAAQQILASAGIEVSADFPAEPLPSAADEVLAPVLREAVTNILRHAAATACTIEVRPSGAALRLRVSNDGVTGHADYPSSDAGNGGHGLANLAARVRGAGGQLVTTETGGRFDLTAEIPVDGPPPPAFSPQTLAASRP